MKERGNFSKECFVEDGNKKVVFSFEVEGGNAGRAILDFYDNFDLHFYSLTSLKVENAFRNQKIGTGLLKKVNGFLEEQRIVGVLINFIPDDLKEIHGIYSKNGWKEVVSKGDNVYVFQPESVSDNQVDRITEFLIKNKGTELM